MNIRTIFLLLATLFAACAGGSGHSASRKQNPKSASQPLPVREYTYTVKNTWSHPTDAYTQGLQFIDGVLWEGTGQYGGSVIQIHDIVKGGVTRVLSLPQSEFGEGITLLGDRLYQLTWQSNTCHLYRRTGDKLEKIKDFRYPGEGWGLTTDGERLYMSNGSENIYVVHPETFRRERRFTVTLNGRPVNYINELEWIEGKIWANVYTTDQILIINPANGVTEGVIDLGGLLPAEEQTPTTDVLNGIAYDPQNKRIFVTGKNWSKIFEIDILER